MIKRRQYVRYSFTDEEEHNVNPGYPLTSEVEDYPAFIPELSSFHHDNFLRTNESLSHQDYEHFVSTPNAARPYRWDSPMLDEYRKSILEGIDLFRTSSHKRSPYLEFTGDEEKRLFEEEIKKRFKREVRDTHFYNEKIPELESFYLTYSPYKLWSELIKFITKIYFIITGEQIHTAVFTYYYLYYYFLFTEYNLEHVYLYFPQLRLFFQFQLFSTFDAVYFNFHEIILGCYLPCLFFFFFSQYWILRSYIQYTPYFVAGIVGFIATFFFFPIYYFCGFNNVFFFLIFSSLLIFFSFFYIFEYKYHNFSENTDYYSYTSYFLPAPQDKPVQLCFPIFYFKFTAWAKSPSQVDFRHHTRFTNFPFTTNVKSIAAYKKRIFKFRLAELKYRSNVHTPVPKSPFIPISGLVFPRSFNVNAYSFKRHKEYIRTYPSKEFKPLTELQDWDYYEEHEQEDWPLYLRDFINHPGGFSEVAFLDFIHTNKSIRSIDGQFSYLPDEEKDFYLTAPSRELIKYLYPYLFLRFWLLTLQPRFEAKTDDIFKFQKIDFPTKNIKGFSPEKFKFVYVPNWLRSSIDNFFILFSDTLDKITFYRYFEFVTPKDSVELASQLVMANNIINDSRFLSPHFFRSLAVFVFRSTFFLKEVDFSTLDIPLLFTYTLLLRQYEEIYFNLSQLYKISKPNSRRYRYLEFCLKVIRLRIPGLGRISVLV
jgi:hypothetical protein